MKDKGSGGPKPDEGNRETLAKEDEAGCVCLWFY